MTVLTANGVDIMLAGLGIVRRIHPLNIQAAVRICRMAISARIPGIHGVALVTVETAQSGMHAQGGAIIACRRCMLDQRSMALAANPHSGIVGHGHWLRCFRQSEFRKNGRGEEALLTSVIETGAGRRIAFYGALRRTKKG